MAARDNSTDALWTWNLFVLCLLNPVEWIHWISFECTHTGKCRISCDSIAKFQISRDFERSLLAQNTIAMENERIEILETPICNSSRTLFISRTLWLCLEKKESPLSDHILFNIGLDVIGNIKFPDHSVTDHL